MVFLTRRDEAFKKLAEVVASTGDTECSDDLMKVIDLPYPDEVKENMVIELLSDWFKRLR